MTRIAALLAVLLIVGGYAFYRVRPQFYDLGFWQLLTANLVGVLGGGYLALWANRTAARHQDRRTRKREEVQRRKRASQALGALQKTIAHNKSELDDVVTALRQDRFQFVFSRADPQAFDPVISRLVETVEDLGLVRECATFRHQLEEFNRMAEAQLELYLLPEMHPRQLSMRTEESEKIQAMRKEVIDKVAAFGGRLSEKAQELDEWAEETLNSVADDG